MSSLVKPYNVCGSLFGSPWSRRGSQNPQKDKKLRNFIFWRAGCSLWWIGGFFWTWEVLPGDPKRYVDKKIELYLIFTFWSSNYLSLEPSPDRMQPGIRIQWIQYVFCEFGSASQSESQESWHISIPALLNCCSILDILLFLTYLIPALPLTHSYSCSIKFLLLLTHFYSCSAKCLNMMIWYRYFPLSFFYILVQSIPALLYLLILSILRPSLSTLILINLAGA